MIGKCQIILDLLEHTKINAVPGSLYIQIQFIINIYDCTFARIIIIKMKHIFIILIY